MTEIVRGHDGDLRLLHSTVDRIAESVGPVRLDEVAASVAAGTLDFDVTFDMRDVRWGYRGENAAPYSTFVAHVLLHRNRMAGDFDAMAATCSHVVTSPGLGEAPPWDTVSSAALIHLDAVVAGAASAVEIDRMQDPAYWRVMYTRLVSGHAGEPLLPSAVLFIADAVAARCGADERSAFLERVRGDLSRLPGDVTEHARRLRAVEDSPHTHSCM